MTGSRFWQQLMGCQAGGTCQTNWCQGRIDQPTPGACWTNQRQWRAEPI